MLAKKGIKDKKLEDLLKNVKGKGDEILDDILSKEGKDGIIKFPIKASY